MPRREKPAWVGKTDRLWTALERATAEFGRAQCRRFAAEKQVIEAAEALAADPSSPNRVFDVGASVRHLEQMRREEQSALRASEEAERAFDGAVAEASAVQRQVGTA